MSDNQMTELLRERLTERGIEWRSGLKGVTFVGDWCFVEYDNGKLAATCEPVLTPEQAIIAALGDEWDGKPFVEYVEHVAKEIHDEAFALLEGCDEPDSSAIYNICGACVDVMRIAGRWRRGESQAEFTTFERATLTAEQVREVIFGNSYYAAYASSQYYAIGIDMQAIADELNAMLGSGECEMYRDEYGVWHCSSCEKGADKTTGNDGALDSWNNSWPPNFCPYCGAKVKAVRR